jgi:Glycosyl hydrolase family 99
MEISRRAFVRSLAAAGVGSAIGPPIQAAQRIVREPAHGAHRLANRFSDLRRHFVFEYYPWYGTSPYRHWDQDDRHPPVDLASNYLPRLGAYDSRSTAVLEQHARWIAESGAGAINVSWWGRDSYEDRAVPTLMDVMAAHDIHVTFHLESYSDRRVRSYASDVEYLITEYGDRRRWDCFLLLQHADGKIGPVFKSFRTLLPRISTDCHGTASSVPDFADDAVWRQQTDQVRSLFAGDFDRLTLLADSLDTSRTGAAGFDGIAIYDNYVRPETWRSHAEDFSARNLVFSFNVNPGFDGIVQRQVEPGSCYRPPAFEPGAASWDWSRAADRDQASRLGLSRISESFHTTVALQTNPQLANVRRDFFLTYINSFNEWHEGHQFEPMRDRADLTADERAVGYHNPDHGADRLALLTALIDNAVGPD